MPRQLFCILILLASLAFFSFTPELMKIYRARVILSFPGKQNEIEVYIFTNWRCPACAKLNPLFKEMAPDILKQARLYFIDLPAPHTESLIRVNQSFLAQPNKTLESYFKARQVLFELAQSQAKPTLEEIKSVLKEQNILYTPIGDDLFQAGQTFFEMVAKSLDAKGAPTIIVYNLRNQKKTMLDDKDLIDANKVSEALAYVRESKTKQELVENKGKPLNHSSLKEEEKSF